jgi:hypothetical protein
MLMEILVALAAEVQVILIDAHDKCDQRRDILAAVASLEEADSIK